MTPVVTMPNKVRASRGSDPGSRNWSHDSAASPVPQATTAIQIQPRSRMVCTNVNRTNDALPELLYIAK
jgi:hypothetical protein